MAHHEADLRQMVYAESEINAYDNIPSSTKTQDNFNFDNRSVTDSASHDAHSVVSYATSNQSEEHHESNKKKSHKKYQKIIPHDQHRSKYQGSSQVPPNCPKINKLNSRYSNTSISTVATINTVTTINTISSTGRNHMKDSFAKQMILDSKSHPNAPWNNSRVNYYGGGLAKKLNNSKIRESMEMDLNSSMQSVGSTGVPSARLSDIAKKSVITLRMISHNPSKQVRIKLYLPHSENEYENSMDKKPQIIVLFVNKCSTMHTVKTFVEENYPNGVLMHKIAQLCIADDDGEIDEDFPPINKNQDVTTLGVQNFWIDRIFENKKKPSIIYEHDNEMKEIVRTDKHKDTMKERLISDASNEEYSESDEWSKSENQNKKCCWCCFVRNSNRYESYDDEEEEEESLEYSQYQKLVVHENKHRGSNDSYNPPKQNLKPTPKRSDDKNPFDPDSSTANIRYASL